MSKCRSNFEIGLGWFAILSWNPAVLSIFETGLGWFAIVLWNPARWNRHLQLQLLLLLHLHQTKWPTRGDLSNRDLKRRRKRMRRFLLSIRWCSLSEIGCFQVHLMSMSARRVRMCKQCSNQCNSHFASFHLRRELLADYDIDRKTVEKFALLGTKHLGKERQTKLMFPSCIWIFPSYTAFFLSHHC